MLISKDKITPSQILDTITSIYWTRKRAEGLAVKKLAAEIGVSVGTLHASLSGKHTSDRTIEIYKRYLSKTRRARTGRSGEPAITKGGRKGNGYGGL